MSRVEFSGGYGANRFVNSAEVVLIKFILVIKNIRKIWDICINYNEKRCKKERWNATRNISKKCFEAEIKKCELN